MRRPSLKQFLTGTEFRSDQFEGYYNALLHRPSDPGGLGFWVGQLNAGVHNETLLGLLGGSDEVFADHGSSNAGLVTALGSLSPRTPAHP